MKRELGFYFISPIGYIVIVLFLVATGLVYFYPFFLQGRADMRNFFTRLPIILTFVVPAVTMRLFSEEYSSGSYEVVLTFPVTTVDILLGKFLASLGFTLLMLIPTISYPLFVSSVGSLDTGPVLGGYLGTIFLMAQLCAFGLFASSLTKNQIIAFLIGAVFCAVVTLVHLVLFLLPSWSVGFFQFFSATVHFDNIGKGILDSRDLLYFVSMAFLALHFTNVVIEKRK